MKDELKPFQIASVQFYLLHIKWLRERKVCRLFKAPMFFPLPGHLKMKTDLVALSPKIPEKFRNLVTQKSENNF